MLNAQRFPTSLWEKWWWVLWWVRGDCCQCETFSQDLSNEHELHSTLTAKQSLICTVIRGNFNVKGWWSPALGQAETAAPALLHFLMAQVPTVFPQKRLCSGSAALKALQLGPTEPRAYFRPLIPASRPSHSPPVSQAELGSTHTRLFIPKLLVISANQTQGTAFPG